MSNKFHFRRRSQTQTESVLRMSTIATRKPKKKKKLERMQSNIWTLRLRRSHPAMILRLLILSRRNHENILPRSERLGSFTKFVRIRKLKKSVLSLRLNDVGRERGKGYGRQETLERGRIELYFPFMGCGAFDKRGLLRRRVQDREDVGDWEFGEHQNSPSAL